MDWSCLPALERSAALRLMLAGPAVRALAQPTPENPAYPWWSSQVHPAASPPKCLSCPAIGSRYAGCDNSCAACKVRLAGRVQAVCPAHRHLYAQSWVSLILGIAMHACGVLPVCDTCSALSIQWLLHLAPCPFVFMNCSARLSLMAFLGQLVLS
jgi:hypothetical protein